MIPSKKAVDALIDTYHRTKGDWVAALEDAYLIDFPDSMKEYPSVITPIIKLELSLRTAHALKQSGINTVGDIISLSESQILKTPNFGLRSFNEIKHVLLAAGFEGRNEWLNH